MNSRENVFHVLYACHSCDDYRVNKILMQTLDIVYEFFVFIQRNIYISPFPPPYIFEKLIHPATSPDAFNIQTKMYSPYHAEYEIYIFMHQIIIR